MVSVSHSWKVSIFLEPLPQSSPLPDAELSRAVPNPLNADSGTIEIHLASSFMLFDYHWRLLNLRLQRFAVDGFLWSIGEGGDIVHKLNSFWNAYTLLFRGINCNCKLTLHQMSTAAAAAAKSLHWCLILYDLMDCSLPGSSVHGILQARILEWVAISFSRGSSWPRDWTLKWAHLIAFLLPWQELQLSLADNSESSISPIKIL